MLKISLFLSVEAKYAYKLERKIIPLQLEEGYQPDGWLGLVQGMDLYYAFYSDKEFDKNMPKLLTLLGENAAVEDTVDGKLRP